MTNRRPLIEGIKPTSPPVDSQLEKEFVYQKKSPLVSTPAPTPATAMVEIINQAPFSTRIRADYVAALKRASLERQLAGISPHMLKDILEQALEPWLKANGYITTD